MTDLAVHSPYTPRAYSVHTACAACLLMLGATGGSAETLTEFETRSLTPTFEVRESDASGLSSVEVLADQLAPSLTVIETNRES